MKRYADSSNSKKRFENGLVCLICIVDAGMAGIGDNSYSDSKQQTLGMYLYIPGVYYRTAVFRGDVPHEVNVYLHNSYMDSVLFSDFGDTFIQRIYHNTLHIRYLSGLWAFYHGGICGKRKRQWKMLI